MASSPSPNEPQRMSALYQYHNAPEVAPAHGLEYDDTIYAHSDKYPVVNERNLDGNYNFVSENRPPRIIFGMKIRTFLVVAAIMTMVVVGAALGGALGGQQLRENQSALQQAANVTSAPSPTPTATTYVAPVPTYTPLSDCPQSNATLYTSQSAKLQFTRYCSLSNPLTPAEVLNQAFVYSFADCIELCAAVNIYSPTSGSANCTAAVYEPGHARPANCWAGTTPNTIDHTTLLAANGTDVAIINS